MPIGGGHPWLQPGRRAAVLASVNDVLSRAPVNELGRPQLPIDVRALALEHYGLRIIDVPGLAGKRTQNVNGKPLSGMLDFARSRIYVDSDNTLRRQRFTIAHELGHYVLDHHAIIGDQHTDAYISYGEGNQEPTQSKLELAEREANRFAGMLLIPPDELDAQITRLETIDLLSLADLFDVSAPAMRVHLSRYLFPSLKHEYYH